MIDTPEEFRRDILIGAHRMSQDALKREASCAVWRAWCSEVQESLVALRWWWVALAVASLRCSER